MAISQFPDKIKQFILRHFKKQKDNHKGKVYRICIGIGMFVVLAVFFCHYNLAYTVKVDGKKVGIVRQKGDFTKVVDKIQADLYKKYDTKVTFHQTITYQRIKAGKEKITEKSQLENALKRVMDFKVKAYHIHIQDQPIVALSTREEANKVLEQIKKIYTSPAEGVHYQKVYFIEKVAIQEATTAIKNLKKSDEAIKIILQGTEETKMHAVQLGESLWTIAQQYQLPIDGLIKSNPQIDPEKLQLGQEINLVTPKPLLTLVTVEQIRYEEAVPFNIAFEETDALYKGEKKIKIEGQNGKREVAAEITKYNGAEVSRNIIEENIIEDVQQQIVLVGTKKKSLMVATGSIGSPTRGRLTSRFGWRWGRKHEGIDIAARIGTPVQAADGGKVVFSGVRGGYGKFVIIDHGNGIKTCYGHNSKLLVSKGDRVYKGQKIAEVGSTGRSTGPHLHFEVRKNNVPVNPLNYVKY